MLGRYIIMGKLRPGAKLLLQAPRDYACRSATNIGW